MLLGPKVQVLFQLSLAVLNSDMIVQTVSTLTSFVLVMLLYPEVQMRAQKELDAVVGLDRLPEFSDRHSLPYTNAILKEVIRLVSGPASFAPSYLLKGIWASFSWNPVAPLGVLQLWIYSQPLLIPYQDYLTWSLETMNSMGTLSRQEPLWLETPGSCPLA